MVWPWASHLTSLCSQILWLYVWLKRWLGKKFQLFLILWMFSAHIYLSLFTWGFGILENTDFVTIRLPLSLLQAGLLSVRLQVSGSNSFLNFLLLRWNLWNLFWATIQQMTTARNLWIRKDSCLWLPFWVFPICPLTFPHLQPVRLLQVSANPYW